LILKSFPLRIGFNEGGNREVGDKPREPIEGEFERGPAVTKI
jgi:hypothetical protein